MSYKTIIIFVVLFGIFGIVTSCHDESVNPANKMLKEETEGENGESASGKEA